jgi:hypothetical protein
VKLGLQVDIDRYTPGRTFLGLRALVLDNLRQDPAMMREPLAMAIFARLGQIAPREAFCRLFINGEYEGLYAVVEDIDPSFLLRTVGRDDGYLFEYRRPGPYYGEYLGDDLAGYAPIFEPRTQAGRTLEELYEPVRALFEAVNAPEEAAGRGDLEALIDLEQYVAVLAVEAFLGDEDGLLGIDGMNNFYLYRDAGSLQHRLIVWDRDRAFTLLDTSVLEHVAPQVLARRALSYADLFDLYLRVLEDTARSVSENGWLALEIDRLWRLVGAAAYADARKPFTDSEFEDSVEFLRRFAAVRPALVLGEVAALRQPGGRAHQPDR